MINQRITSNLKKIQRTIHAEFVNWPYQLANTLFDFLEKKKDIHFMLPARALFYAILVATFIAIVSGLLISTAFLQKDLHSQDLLLQQLFRNSSSGITLGLASSANEFELQEDLYNTGNDSVAIWGYRWGLLNVICSEAKVRKQNWSQTHKRIAFSGSQLSQLEKSALYISDQNKVLSLAGKTMIKGDVYLSKAGVKRAYVSGQSFIGDKLINGKIKRSRKFLPPIDTDLMTSILNGFKSKTTIQTIENKLWQSFLSPPLHIEGTTLRLDDLNFSGRISIRADSIVFIANSCTFEDIMVHAPIVIVEKGFKGSLQIFATESVDIQENVTLRYPSVIGLIRPASSKSVSNITLSENSSVNGLILGINQGNQSNKVKLTIERNAHFTGKARIEGVVEHKGKISGHLSTNGFTLKTPSSIYDNHIFQASIDFSAMPSNMYLPHLQGQSVYPKKIIKWLN